MVWRPTSDEKRVLDYWFDSIDKESIGIVGGARVVNFLKSTGLNRDILRTIWNLVDIQQSGNVDRIQFYKLIRLTTVCCNIPLPKGYPSEKLYLDTIHQSFSLPNLSVSKDILNATSTNQQQPQINMTQPVYPHHHTGAPSAYYTNPVPNMAPLHEQHLPPAQYGYPVVPPNHQQSMPPHNPGSYYQPPHVGMPTIPPSAAAAAVPMTYPMTPIASHVPPVTSYPVLHSVPGPHQPVYGQQSVQHTTQPAQMFPPHGQQHQHMHPTPAISGTVGIPPNTSFQPQQQHQYLSEPPNAIIHHPVIASQYQDQSQQQPWIHGQTPSAKMNPNLTNQYYPPQQQPPQQSYRPHQQQLHQPPLQPMNFTSTKTATNTAAAVVDEEFSEFETAASTVHTATSSSTHTQPYQSQPSGSMMMMTNAKSMTDSSDDIDMGDFMGAIIDTPNNTNISSNNNNVPAITESMEPSTPRHLPPPAVSLGNEIPSTKATTITAAAAVAHNLLPSFSLDLNSSGFASHKQSTPSALNDTHSQPSTTTTAAASFITTSTMENSHLVTSNGHSLPIMSATTTPSTTTTTAATAGNMTRPALNDRMRFLDDVIEMDLMAEQEQWDDFTTGDEGTLQQDGQQMTGSNNNDVVDNSTVVGDSSLQRGTLLAFDHDNYDNGNNSHNNDEYKPADSYDHPPEPSSAPPAFLSDDYDFNHMDGHKTNKNDDDDDDDDTPPPPSYTPSLVNASSQQHMMSLPTDHHHHHDGTHASVSMHKEEEDDDFGDFESSFNDADSNSSNNISSSSNNINIRSSSNNINSMDMDRKDDTVTVPSSSVIPSINNKQEVIAVNNINNNDDDDDINNNHNHPSSSAADNTNDGDNHEHDHNDFGDFETSYDTDQYATSTSKAIAESGTSGAVEAIVTAEMELKVNNDDDDDHDININNDIIQSSTLSPSSSSSSSSTTIQQQEQQPAILTTTFTKQDISDAFSFSDDDGTLDVELPPLPPSLMMTGDHLSARTASATSTDSTMTGKKSAKEILYDLTHIMNPPTTTTTTVKSSSSSSSSLTNMSLFHKDNHNNDHNNNTGVNDDEEEDDDFGDFESHGADTQSNSHSHNNHHDNSVLFPSSSSSSLEPASSSSSSSLLFPENLSFPSFPSTTTSFAAVIDNNSSTTTSATTHSLDLFAFDGNNSSNNISATAAAVASTTTAAVSAAGFDDFDPFGSEITHSNNSNSNSTNNSNSFDFDFPATMNSNSNNNSSSSSSAQAKDKLISSTIDDKKKSNTTTTTTNNTNNNNTNKHSNKHLSSRELDALTTHLFEHNYYQEAYQCHLQSLTQHIIETYEIEKKLAVENDELEIAMEFKKKIMVESKKLASVDMEWSWMNCIENNQADDSLEEIIDIIHSISQVMAEKCRKRYLAHLPSSSSSSSSSLLEKLKYYVIAKRNIRLVMMLLTTHINYPDYWKSLLSYIDSTIQNANKHLIQFDSLNVKEQSFLMSSDDMKRYLAGLLQIAEIGMYVSATCLDAMVREKQASSVIQSIQLFLDAAAASWFNMASSKDNSSNNSTNNTNHRLVPSITELSDMSYFISSDTVYCNLTLRPILRHHTHTNTTTTTSATGASATSTGSANTNISYVQGRSYHQGAINCWLVSLASPPLTLPVSDDPFH